MNPDKRKGKKTHKFIIFKHKSSSQRFEDTVNLKFGNPITLMDKTIRCNSSFTTFFSKSLNRMKL
ncbi:hypothetical protein MtrunA17_Chr6g0478441 [Medicago truncatula]|uniref:Uncharacterized protein n=1 Tax=Medicago truncatula TaxID=3880 RepID=A0A396HG06_MEDTR|nr:hypothetical protein MtrunA17_Chr6g0478441 [Medicago truncatula]